MKVSVNWIKQFLDFGLPPIDELVEKIGAQLGAVDEVIDLGERYKGVLVAKVVSCEKHPNADKLVVCAIDDGGVEQNVPRDSNGHVQIVSRALNEHGNENIVTGSMVGWIPPGGVVPRSYEGEKFTLEARDMRGVTSYGMLCSAYELAVGEDHSGVMQLDKSNAKPGGDFAELYKLNDYIIDIENKMFTHRPDCFGALGVAREIAGVLHKPFKSPDWYVPSPELPKIETDMLPLEVKNGLPELVPRFTAVAIRDVKVGPSPTWLQVALAKVGQKSINNIVDLTNFYMLVTGQPLHAYDYDKVKAFSRGDKAMIVARHPRKGEKIKLLNGKEIEPRSEAIMIATDEKLIGIGGVMGGSETEVDSSTKNIVLECANFDMYSIRRTSMEHGLFTDAVTRFTKGQSPLQCLAVLLKTTSDIQKLSGGKVAGEVIDHHAELPTALAVRTTPEFINSRLGLALDPKTIEALLGNVEFGVDTNEGERCFKAPFWRTDIEIPEDIVEEVGRLYGYDHLPLELPKRHITPTQKDELLTAKSKIRSILSKAGANEVLTYSFVHGNLLDKVGQDKSNAYQVANALSPDLQYYRLSLIPSLLEKVHPNIKAGYDEFALFEVGKAHLVGQTDDEGLPREDELTALVIASADKLKKSGVAYYEARKYLTNLIPAELTFKPVPEDMKQYDITKPYNMERTAFVYAGETFLGLIGEFRTEVQKALKLPKYCAGFELDTTEVQKVIKTTSGYTPLPRFPKVAQDITLKVPAELSYQDLFDFVWSELNKIRPKNTLPTLTPIDIYQREDDKKHKQITLRLEIASYERTLTDTEVNKLLNMVAAVASNKISASRI